MTKEDIEQADKMLHEFVSRFEVLYEKTSLSCNVHLTLHLAEIVKRFGPLRVTSCFPFESFNGELKRLVHGTKHADLQIHSATSLLLCEKELRSKYLKNDTSIHAYAKI